jgi:hypothetical protein
MAGWSKAEQEMLTKALRERDERTAAVTPEPEPTPAAAPLETNPDPWADATPVSMGRLILKRELLKWGAVVVGLFLFVWLG